LGFTVPFRVALFSVMDVAATDVAMGDETGILVESPPPPPQDDRRDIRSNERNGKKATLLMVPPGLEVRLFLRCALRARLHRD
jgi:hypothetical protein